MLNALTQLEEYLQTEICQPLFLHGNGNSLDVLSTIHYAAYPEDLCKIPILSTCPPDGVVLDPFCGTGTTNFVAQNLFRKSIGIDISQRYLEIARWRCNKIF